jgi:hypothetical protein
MAGEEPTVEDARRQPPAWASWLLPWLVRADRAESIDGDLLEEYGERVGRSGRWRADGWYVRQVAEFLWRLSWPFGLLVALQAVTRTIADIVVPPENYQLRSTLTTWGAIYAYLFAGAYAAWRTHRARSGAIVTGPIAALAAHMIGSVIAISSTVILYFTVISQDAAMVRRFQMIGDWGEVWGVPVVTTPIVIVLGEIGGLVGGMLSPRRQASRIEH